MLILSEENSRLKGTKYRLPNDVYTVFKNIVKNNMPSNDTAYKKAKNVVKDGGVVTMEWLKNMKHYFTKHKDESDPEFIKMGGYLVKYYVESTLDRLTDSVLKMPKKTNPTKPRKTSSNLSGNRGEKSSASLSMVKSLISDIIPRMESIKKTKNIVISEEQVFELKNKLKTN